MEIHTVTDSCPDTSDVEQVVTPSSSHQLAGLQYLHRLALSPHWSQLLAQSNAVCQCVSISGDLQDDLQRV